jgi:hypothetical protein
MDFSDDRFMSKNQSLANAFETDRTKGKTVVRSQFGADAKEEAQSCYNCKTRQKCDKFRTWRTGGSSGVVSVGADHKYLCEKYVQDPVGKVTGVSQQQVKSMLKGAMKGRL